MYVGVSGTDIVFVGSRWWRYVVGSAVEWLCCSVRTLAQSGTCSSIKSLHSGTRLSAGTRNYPTSSVFFVVEHICRTFCPETLNFFFVLFPSHRQAGHGHRWVKDWGCHFEVLEPLLLTNMSIPLTPFWRRHHTSKTALGCIGVVEFYDLYLKLHTSTYGMILCPGLLRKLGSIAKLTGHSGRLNNTVAKLTSELNLQRDQFGCFWTCKSGNYKRSVLMFVKSFSMLHHRAIRPCQRRISRPRWAMADLRCRTSWARRARHLHLLLLTGRGGLPIRSQWMAGLQILQILWHLKQDRAWLMHGG